MKKSTFLLFSSLNVVLALLLGILVGRILPDRASDRVATLQDEFGRLQDEMLRLRSENEVLRDRTRGPGRAADQAEPETTVDVVESPSVEPEPEPEGLPDGESAGPAIARSVEAQAYLGREVVGRAWIQGVPVRTNPETGKVTYKPVVILDPALREIFTRVETRVVERPAGDTHYTTVNESNPIYAAYNSTWFNGFRGGFRHRNPPHGRPAPARGSIVNAVDPVTPSVPGIPLYDPLPTGGNAGSGAWSAPSFINLPRKTPAAPATSLPGTTLPRTVAPRTVTTR